MKFWQKLYLAALALFLCIYTFSMLALVQSLYNNNLKTQKEKGQQEALWLAQRLTADFAALGETPFSEQELSVLLDSALYEYTMENSRFSIYRDGELLFTNAGFEDIALVPNKTGTTVQARNYWMGDVCYYCVWVPFAQNPGYCLLYLHELAGLRAFLKQLTALCLMIGIAGTVLLAVLLYVLVKKMTTPLGKLEQAAKSLALGAYDTRVNVDGADEFAAVADSFNGMAQEIQQHVDALEEENRNKQIFIDNLAHEMNTPLTSIRGYGEYLQRGSDLLSEEECYEALDFIVRESERLSSMGKQLLMLANLRNGDFSFGTVSVSALFAALEKLFAMRAEETGVCIRFSQNVERVSGDFALLESLLSNLIENGIRACSEGGQIQVSIESTENTDWKLTVKDNGRGIPKEALPYIMEPFYRTDKARSRANGGAGLGLALCRQIVTLHRGEISVSSEVGEGTEIAINFTTL